MNIIHLKEVDSTNDYLKKNINSLGDKTVVYADRQTSGHGRLGRSWVDTGADNLYMSILLKHCDKVLPVYANLTQYMSVVLAKFFEDAYGINAKIKWPNDVLVNGKKIAGILCETSVSGNQFRGLVLGVGVNLNTQQNNLELIDRPAASLSVEINKPVDRNDFLNGLISRFFLNYDEFLKTGFGLIKKDYIKSASFIGLDIKINVLGKIHSGIASGITDDGAIVLKESGAENIYFAGDIL